MKKTKHNTGHRWTTDELKILMRMWDEDCDVGQIAASLRSTRSAILKIVQRLRNEGIPLRHHRRGHVPFRHNRSWTQGEVEFLMRRRDDPKATIDGIASELGRTWCAVNAMICALRRAGVDIAMRGSGVRRLWDSEALKCARLSMPDVELCKAAGKKRLDFIGFKRIKPTNIMESSK